MLPALLQNKPFFCVCCDRILALKLGICNLMPSLMASFLVQAPVKLHIWNTERSNKIHQHYKGREIDVVLFNLRIPYKRCDLDHIIDLYLLTMIYKPSHAQAVKLLVKELYSLQ